MAVGAMDMLRLSKWPHSKGKSIGPFWQWKYTLKTLLLIDIGLSLDPEFFFLQFLLQKHSRFWLHFYLEFHLTFEVELFLLEQHKYH